MKIQGFDFRFSIFLSLFFLLLPSCDPLKEMTGSGIGLATPGAGWNYPYHLVIGGNLSETLSVLTIRGPDEYKFFKDVVATGQSLNDTVLHNGEIYAVCSLSNSVIVYDAADLSIRREIGVGESTNPMSLAFDDDGLAWVANLVSNDVRAFDLSPDTPDDERLAAVIPMPSGDELPRDGDRQGYARPGDVLVAGDRLFAICGNMNDLYVSAGLGVLVEVDIPSRRRVRSVTLAGRNPIDIELAGDRLVVADAGIYDMDAGGFVGDGLVEMLNPDTLEQEGAIEMRGAPFRMSVSPWGPVFFENGARGTVLAADLDTMTELEPIALPEAGGPGVSYASGIAADGHGFLYAAEFNHDKLYVIDSSKDYGIVASFDVNAGPDTLLILHGGNGHE